MTPKEKAEELFDKMHWAMPHPSTTNAETYIISKQCALIAVDEIIKASPLEPNDTPEWVQPEDWFSDSSISAEKYWQEVKQEIEKL